MRKLIKPYFAVQRTHKESLINYKENFWYTFILETASSACIIRVALVGCPSQTFVKYENISRFPFSVKSIDQNTIFVLMITIQFLPVEWIPDIEPEIELLQ